MLVCVDRLTHRYEASLWLNRKQVYLGGYDSEEEAAKAYDLAALLFKGEASPTNFPLKAYEKELSDLKGEPKASYTHRAATVDSVQQIA